MAMKQITREAAAELYYQTLRSMHPDKVVEDRMSEASQEDAPNVSR
ncbi:hypothetical protein [Mycobacteroides abscessus]|nr:hypothetical protein [Mycobacteroides abscessus]